MSGFTGMTFFSPSLLSVTFIKSSTIYLESMLIPTLAFTSPRSLLIVGVFEAVALNFGSVYLTLSFVYTIFSARFFSLSLLKAYVFLFPAISTKSAVAPADSFQKSTAVVPFSDMRVISVFPLTLFLPSNTLLLPNFTVALSGFVSVYCHLISLDLLYAVYFVS